jgi:nucleoid-associated protein YgaU
MREQSSYVDDLEPEELSEWELQDDDSDRTRILWGRVTVLLLALGLAFFLGRTTGSVGASPTRIDELEAEAPAPVEQTPRPDTGGQGANQGRARTYVVKPGDTLRDLAVRFYGDVDLAQLIAEANGIDDTSQLRIGQELKIPSQEP